MHRSKTVTATHEMYLKVLRQMGDARGVARVTELARGLGVSTPTVSTGLKRLEKLNFVEHDRYGYVALTEIGDGVAKCVLNRYEAIHALLTEVLGVDAETAAVDACMMEHAVSQETVDRTRVLVARLKSSRTRIGSVPRKFKTDLCINCAANGACGVIEQNHG